MKVSAPFLEFAQQCSSRVREFSPVLLALLLFAGGCKSRDTDSAVKDETVAPEFRGAGSFPIWAYDGGPDTTSRMGVDLINLTAKIPYFPGLSQAIYGEQMFRPAFGPIPWRMMQKPNSVKILFIGQDGTHIAEAAGRPATAGFGGRAQDLAKYFGVGSSAAFINTYAYTIRWQYGVFDAPIISTRAASPQMNFGSFTSNQVWLITQDQDSPVAKWRNNMISWIIRNNKESLKMIVLFGGAARDAMGTFAVSKGATVGTRYSEADLANVKVPEFEYRSAGGNKQAATPVSAQGKDLLEEFNGAAPRYSDPAAMKTLQTKFRDEFNREPQTWMNKMVFSNGGIGGSGVLHPAQLGGYDIDDKMVINGAKTISLKGLRLEDGTTIENELLVTQLPHPTALSMMTPQKASEAVRKGLTSFGPYKEAGWKIEADPGFTNSFAEGLDYRYARGDMGTEYYDFGAPNSRMVNVSSASRDGSNVIIFGTRDRVTFNRTQVRNMTKAKPSKLPPEKELWLTRPNSTNGSTTPGPDNRRFTFDAGPGEEFAKLMKTTLPTDAAFRAKREVNGDFGHYRGTFKNPRVLIIADPDGDDDLITARALSGTRGQFLHGLMQDIGVNDQYLIVKTAPYRMDSSWDETFAATKAYREALITKIMQSTQPQMIITDGTYAAQEIARILPSPPCPVISIQRQGQADSSGIADAVAAIKQVPGFSAATFNGKQADIPRSHLSFYARTWEGTSGDRAITAEDQRYAGAAFAFVAPEWAYRQRYPMPPSEIESCEQLFKKEMNGKVRIGGEKVPDFIRRRDRGGAVESPCQKLASTPTEIAEVALPEPPAEPQPDPTPVDPTPEQ